MQLREKRRVYGCWKKGQATEKDYNVVRPCREKFQLEINLSSAVVDSKKCFHKYTGNKRRTKLNLCPLLNAVWNTEVKDEEKAELLFTHCVSASSSRISCSLDIQPPRAGK